MGFSITRGRIRNALCAIHPIDTALRWRGQQVHHQPYRVPGPNSLWHLGKEYDLMQYSITMTFYILYIIDGHHKLNRLGMVTHCAIDGYSRLVVYIKCSSNNRASTVLTLFQEAAQQHGLPSRIRVDQGGENAFVVQHMLEVRGEERRAVLIGSSVNNKRMCYLHVLLTVLLP